MNSKQLDSVVFYKMEENDPSVPKITDCIRIDDELHVRLFHISCTILFHSGSEINVDQ